MIPCLLLLSVSVGAAATRIHQRSPARFPYSDFGVVARRCKNAWILGMPCNAIDTAGVGIERFDKEPVRPPNV